MRVANEIRARLAKLAPARLELVDESARHAGHAGARPQGESHFRLLIVADAFSAEFRCEAPVHKLAAATRKSMLLLFARAAALRLQSLADPTGPYGDVG